MKKYVNAEVLESWIKKEASLCVFSGEAYRAFLRTLRVIEMLPAVKCKDAEEERFLTVNEIDELLKKEESETGSTSNLPKKIFYLIFENKLWIFFALLCALALYVAIFFLTL